MRSIFLVLTPILVLAQAQLRHPDSLELAEFAKHPQVGNPVAIEIAADGRVFVAEQYRNSGFLPQGDSDQIRLLTDDNHDGRADRSQTFASFREPLDGLASGVLPRGDEVWVTCLPHLWRFRDADRDGKPESAERVHTGFGVRASDLGHDLHGLVIGPDNRLYFSVGDRGFHITLPSGDVLHGPDEGAVFRCDSAGANLELIHRGLRNPQAIAFDEWGNLFGADSSCDKGDKSRLVQIIDGGNSGWRMHYQALAGPWMQEDMWMRESACAPLWHTRPADYLGAGPSGMTFSAVGAWPELHRNRFYCCNNGGVVTFRVKPDGASFHIVEQADFLKPLRISDCAFGYDGRLYIGNPRNHDISGRVLTLTDPHLDPDASALRALAVADFAAFGPMRLISLLKHPDQRIRLRAQDTLAKQGASAELSRLSASQAAPLLQRVHAIWGLWQLGLAGKGSAQLYALMNDKEPEIRAQAIRVLGDLRKPAAYLKGLEDPSPRVRYFAIRGIGRCKMGILAPKLIEMVESTEDHVLQQAIVIALARASRERSILEQIEHHSARRRLVALLTLRQWQHPAILRFLTDADDSIALEAARAAHDLGIANSATALAIGALRAEVMAEPLRLPMYRRVIAANRALADADSAERLIDIALNGPDIEIQALALTALASWDRELKRDLVTGEWRPLPAAPPVSDASVLRLATRLRESSSDKSVQAAWRALGIAVPEPQAEATRP
jgi:quinoprotein glucose dehydrogenase